MQGSLGRDQALLDRLQVPAQEIHRRSGVLRLLVAARGAAEEDEGCEEREERSDEPEQEGVLHGVTSGAGRSSGGRSILAACARVRRPPPAPPQHHELLMTSPMPPAPGTM